MAVWGIESVAFHLAQTGIKHGVPVMFISLSPAKKPGIVSFNLLSVGSGTVGWCDKEVACLQGKIDFN